MRPRQGLTPQQSNQLGRALMALAVLKVLCTFAVARRKCPPLVTAAVTTLVGLYAGLLFWAGSTMATNRFDDADFGDEDAPTR